MNLAHTDLQGSDAAGLVWVILALLAIVTLTVFALAVRDRRRTNRTPDRAPATTRKDRTS